MLFIYALDHRSNNRTRVTFFLWLSAEEWKAEPEPPLSEEEDRALCIEFLRAASLIQREGFFFLAFYLVTKGLCEVR